MGFQSELSLAYVEKVYSGKPNTCCCGCAGDYTYNSCNVDYPRTGEEARPPSCNANDPVVEEVMRVVLAAENIVVGRNNFSAIVDDKLFIVYPTKDFYYGKYIPTVKDALEWIEHDVAEVLEGTIELLRPDPFGGLGLMIHAKQHDYLTSLCDRDGELGLITCTPSFPKRNGGEGGDSCNDLTEPLTREGWSKIMETIIETEAMPEDCACGEDHHAMDEDADG